MGLNQKQQNCFKVLQEMATLKTTDQAFGGWHDAGDWDRRIQHLKAVRQLLWLAEQRADFASSLELTIPEKDNDLPDLVDEALWGMDVFVRLQQGDGGVPGGIESTGHPRFGETSWLESQDVLVYAADPWSSYELAATSAIASRLLQAKVPGRSKKYADAAHKAFAFAETALSPDDAAHPVINQSRNLAAIELFKLSENAKYDEIFEATFAYDGQTIPWNGRQWEAVFSYEMAHRAGLPTNRRLRQAGTGALIARADWLVSQPSIAGFGQIANPRTPQGYGYTSAVPADAADILIKAHALSGNQAFLKAIISDSLFGLGANPDNFVFTTGLGIRSVPTVLHADGLINGKLPDGITIFGLWSVADRGKRPNMSSLEMSLNPGNLGLWPVHETFSGDLRVPQITEFSIEATLGPSAFVWGYLAAQNHANQENR